ncbi:tripartite tricarboxylate transporter TctB family protein [Enterovirga aerilata]|uniref:Tripartite tricarboxylate transporter TctB family protein n=1 Tax=Enterovirga aerilata TaxID=2730920 RepID=A0A849I9T1_9HYPH|nr:tripartite tricarboxylate transporter TctB family protein [Enterovirga sp. DB1703]NNM74594.1 tripartite tricarboxylate transporter TctB family protein [Enterovirga sp. DB1703]
MRINAQAVAAAFWLSLAAFLIVAGRDLGIGSASEPGSGFLVFWGGVLIALFAAGMAVESVRGAPESLASLWKGARADRVLIVSAALAAYAVSLTTLGFLLATPPLMLVLLRVVDPVPWRQAVPIALGATLVVWWVLARLLAIQLPAGPLG